MLIRRARGERSLAELARSLKPRGPRRNGWLENPAIPRPAATGKGGGGFGKRLVLALE